MPSNHYLFLSFPLHWPPYLGPSAPPAPTQSFPMLHIVSGFPSPASRTLYELDLSHPLSLFPYSSAGKESAYNAGDPGLLPGSGRSTGDGIGYTLQCSWASLVAQLVKNLPTIQETRLPSVGLEDSLEKGMATHSSILAWRIPWTV